MGIRIGHLPTPAGHHFPKRKSFFFQELRPSIENCRRNGMWTGEIAGVKRIPLHPVKWWFKPTKW